MTNTITPAIVEYPRLANFTNLGRYTRLERGFPRYRTPILNAPFRHLLRSAHYTLHTAYYTLHTVHCPPLLYTVDTMMYVRENQAYTHVSPIELSRTSKWCTRLHVRGYGCRIYWELCDVRGHSSRKVSRELVDHPWYR